MEQLFLILVWLAGTFLIASFSVILGKKYGVVYPTTMLGALVVISNILASKIVVLGPFTVPAGILAYSAIFLITDLLSEIWGKKEARQAVWAGFYANILLVVSVWIAMTWQAAPFALEFSGKFAEVLALTPRIVLGSMTAYLLSQHHDVWAFHFWKEKTSEKHLWLRNNASTIVSQFIDTVVFITIAFAGVVPIFPLILGVYTAKITIALIDTPFMYLILRITENIRSNENIEKTKNKVLRN